MQLALPLAALLLTGCAITQNVTPVSRPLQREICVIENPDVRPGFLTAYSGALTEKGLQPRTVERTSPLNVCPLTSRYIANWRWDMALYMAFAELTVYENGAEIGKATYDSMRGGANFGKFIDADKKVKELVDQLFPAPSFAVKGDQS